MDDPISCIGLIAGEGVLPVEFSRKAAGRGWQVVAVGVTPKVHPTLVDHVAHFKSVPITEWDRVIRTLKEAGVKTVFLLGTISKGALFSGAPMDERFVSIVQRAKDGRDNELFLAFAADLYSEGITIGEQAALLPELVSEPRIVTRRAPTEAELKDIAFACTMAKELARLDIGQTVVVKQQAVLAVEAIEGTNETLRRGAILGMGDVVAVKVAKPNQDMRFDMPAVGPDTVRTMIEAGVNVLAFEAYRTLLLQKDEMIRLADEAGLVLVALDPAEEALSQCEL